MQDGVDEGGAVNIILWCGSLDDALGRLWLGFAAREPLLDLSQAEFEHLGWTHTTTSARALRARGGAGNSPTLLFVFALVSMYAECVWSARFFPSSGDTDHALLLGR